jgi:hypothetical protein
MLMLTLVDELFWEGLVELSLSYGVTWLDFFKLDRLYLFGVDPISIELLD